MAARRRLFHDDEPRARQILDETPGDDLRHDLVGVVNALSTLKAQRERQRLGEIVGIDRREFSAGGRRGDPTPKNIIPWPGRCA
jgi:hypothetical protein